MPLKLCVQWIGGILFRIASIYYFQRFQKCQYAKTKLFRTEGRGWGLRSDESIKVMCLKPYHLSASYLFIYLVFHHLLCILAFKNGILGVIW